MPGSGTKENAMRLLAAFHDRAKGKLKTPVALGGPDSDEDGAADAVGSNWDSSERDVALRYLLDQEYVQASDDSSGYTLTLRGLEEARAYLKLTNDEKGSRMQDKRQRQLMTLISLVMATIISQPITNYISEQIPERRGVKDDLLEAALEGVVRAISIFGASLLVRKIAGRRQ